MAHTNFSAVMRYVRRATRSSSPQGLTDAKLLEEYRCLRNGESFAVLVCRHGPLVHSVCRRVLRHEQDAEDAFQATFLVLASKASSIRKANSLASWLHGVAYRIAIRIKKTTSRKPQFFEDTADQRQAQPVTTAALREAQAIVDDELIRLPEKYRAPFVLCCLEGNSRSEVARDLGWKEGTVSSRIAHARELLQRRLARRGVVLSAVLCILEIGRAKAPAIGPSLVDRTVGAALSFAAGEATAINLASATAVKLASGMLLATSATTKMKIAAALVLACTVMTATGAIARHAFSLSDDPASEGKIVDPSVIASPPQERGPEARPTSSLNSLDRAQIGTHELKMVGGGDASKAPAGLVAVLGDSRLRHSGAAMQLAYTPDGKRLISVGSDQLIRFWDPRTGEETRRFVFPANNYSRFSSLSCLAFNPEAKLIAVGGLSDRVGVWNSASGELKHLLHPKSFVRSLTLSPDGKWLATSQDADTEIWDLASGKRIQLLNGQAKDFRIPVSTHHARALFAPDGSALIVGHPDGKIRWWDPLSGRLVRTIEAHSSAIHALSLSPNGKLIATGGEDSWAKVWDISDGTELNRFRSVSRITDVAFQPNAAVLATSGPGETALWDLLTGAKKQTFEQPDGISPIHLTFRPDGKHLATSGFRIRIWDIETGKPVHTPRSTGSVTPVVFTPDGNSLIAGSEDRSIRKWDLKTLAASELVSGAPSPVKALALSRDALNLAVLADHNSVASVWDLESKIKKHDFRGGSQFSGELAMSSDGKWLALGERGLGVGPSIRIWDARSGAIKGEIRSGKISQGMFFSPDSKKFICVTQSQSPTNRASQIQTWDVETLQENSESKDLSGLASLRSAALSSDGRTLALSGTVFGPKEKAREVILLWDLAKKQQRLVIDVGGPVAQHMAFSPDNRTLLVAPFAGDEITVWDPRDGKRRETIRLGEPISYNIRSLAFANDSRHFAAGMGNGTACIVRIQPAPLEVGEVAAPSPNVPTKPMVAPTDLWKELIGKPAPEFHQARGFVFGNPAKLADFRGRHVLLYFWNYDSDFHFSAIMLWHELYGEEKLPIVVLVPDTKDSTIEGVRTMFERLSHERLGGRPIPFRVMLDGGGEMTVAGTDFIADGANHAAFRTLYGYQGRRLPATALLIDPMGMVQDKVRIPPTGLWRKLEGPIGKPTRSLAWMQEFSKQYVLADEQAVRRIAPPFSQSRSDYLFYLQSLGSERGVFSFPFQGAVRPGELLGVNGEASVRDLLIRLVKLKPFDVAGTDEVLNTKVPGDWVFRAGAEPKLIIQEIGRILKAELRLPIGIEERIITKELIVVKGQYRAPAARTPGADQKIVFSVEPLSQEGAFHVDGRGDLPEIIRDLENIIQRRIIFEAQTPAKLQFFWCNRLRPHYAELQSDTSDADKKLRALLDNLSKQTGLDFRLEKRNVKVWYVTKYDREL